MPSPEALGCCERAAQAFSRGDFRASARAYREALALSGPFPEASNNLGNALMMDGAYREALEAYLEAGYPDAWLNGSVAARALGDLDQARALLDRVLRERSGDPRALAALANLQKDLGRVDLAVDSYRAALDLAPGDPVVRGNLAYMLAFDPRATPEAILEANRAWDRRHAQGLARTPPPWNPGPRLKVGYVSPDFRDHCQSLFTVPLFTRHDRRAVEVFAYASVARPDAITARLKGLAEHWRDCAGTSDADLAEQIRADGIDILVDLTQRMANGRPLLFARRPAPVQVAWLAYPGTTGLAAMDYRLSDPYLDPPGLHEAWYSEATIRLPHTYWCYDPLTATPDPGPLPALATGHVTFGCLNHPCKLNGATLALWDRVLEAVPGSRLLLLAHEGRHRQSILAHFTDPSRVDFTPFRPRPDYLAQYQGIDLCLDTAPYNGHTTSLDAAWMGVPVVTLVGPTVVGRAGWSQLNNLGLPALAAWTGDEFVAIAAAFAQDLPRLAVLRSSLRRRMQASPLMDAGRFARDLEATYRRLTPRT